MRGVETCICQLHSRTASLPSMGMINALTHLNKLLHITGARESFPFQTCQQTRLLLQLNVRSVCEVAFAGCCCIPTCMRLLLVE
jgi:hypothetical protein